MQAWQGEALLAMRVMQSKQSNAPRHAPHHHTTHHTPHHFTPRASVGQIAASMAGGSKPCNADHAKEQSYAKQKESSNASAACATGKASKCCMLLACIAPL